MLDNDKSLKITVNYSCAIFLVTYIHSVNSRSYILDLEQENGIIFCLVPVQFLYNEVINIHV